MGFFDFLMGEQHGPTVPVMPLMERAAPESQDKVETILADIIERRRSGFGIEQARRIPAVAQAYDLVTSHAASFLPLAYRHGQAMPNQPGIVTDPVAYGDRYEFVEQTVASLMDYGACYWRVLGVDDDPSRRVYVLPHDDVAVAWAGRPIIRSYRWMGTPLRAYGSDIQIIDITIRRRAGELQGRGLAHYLDMLYPVWEAEQFAANFFTSGGIPEVVLKAATDLTKEEADDIKALWVGAVNSTIRVAGYGVEPEFPGVDPQRAQLQEARSYGATVAATIFGIPSALLHVQTSGATITYTNPSGAVEELIKRTVAPRYLAPIERAWSRLGPKTQSVRFALGDMQRADIAGRFALYKSAAETVDPKTGEPLMSVAEMRAYEGWGETGDVDDAIHQFDPLPEGPSADIPEEVPVG